MIRKIKALFRKIRNWADGDIDYERHGIIGLIHVYLKD